MAGMLPGVELARKRRIHSTHHQFDYDRNSRPSDPFHRERLPPSSIATTTTTSTMDATALMARMRLEEKLGSFRSRWNMKPQPVPVRVRSSSHVLRPEQIHTSETRTRETEVPRITPQLSRKNSQRDVCSVCLDDLQGLRDITNLPCSHRYHSDCLLPWLAAHSHCPYCRAFVHL